MKRSTVPACIAAAIFVSVAAAADERYFGLEAPRQRPEVFEPAVTAAILPLVATNPAFSGDFRRFVFTAVDTSAPDKVAIRVYEARFDGKRWSGAKPLQLLADPTANSGEPMFSPDGQWLYFTSNGLPGAPYSDTRAYRARVTGAGYEPAQRVPLDVPPTQRIFYPQPLADGSLLLTSRVADSSSRDDVFIAARSGDGFTTPIPLPGDFNSVEDDWDVIEHPQGHLRLWVSARPGGAGRTDIYFARKGDRGEWSPAQSLSAVNTPFLETAPRLTPDGRVLFFQRVEDKRERIYWVDLQSILP
jgi:Tol biopolymer transport system component